VGAGTAGAGELAASVECTMDPVTMLRRVFACEKEEEEGVLKANAVKQLDAVRDELFMEHYGKEGEGEVSERDGAVQRLGARRRTSLSPVSSETGVLARVRIAGSWSSNVALAGSWSSSRVTWRFASDRNRGI